MKLLMFHKNQYVLPFIDFSLLSARVRDPPLCNYYNNPTLSSYHF